MAVEAAPGRTRDAAGVADQLAIADVIHAYARHVRRDEPELVAGLFTQDGFFEMRDGDPDSGVYSVRARLEGPDYIKAHLGAGKGKPHPVPLIHNLMVELDGDTATADCVMEAQIFATDQKVMGEYRDAFQRIDGRWYFASRTFTIFSAASSV
jgi:hypothetical protein